MNDNKDHVNGVEIHLIAYFRIDPELFKVPKYLPDFITYHVRDRRLECGRRLLIQIRVTEYFLHLTEYCFHHHP